MTDNTSGLRQRKKKKLREQIVRTAVKLFNSRGYQETRVADIVAELDISSPTFFRYFPSKDAVLREIRETGSDAQRKRFAERLTTSPRQSMSFESSLRDWIRSVPSVVARNKSLLLAVWAAPDADPSRQQKRDKALSTLEIALARGQQRGEIATDLPKEQLAQILSGIFKRIVTDWASPDEPPYDLEERLNAAFSVFLRGAMAAPASAESLPSPADAESEASDSN